MVAKPFLGGGNSLGGAEFCSWPMIWGSFLEFKSYPFWGTLGEVTLCGLPKEAFLDGLGNRKLKALHCACV